MDPENNKLTVMLIELFGSILAGSAGLDDALAPIITFNNFTDHAAILYRNVSHSWVYVAQVKPRLRPVRRIRRGFGANPCVVCQGNVCTNICTKAEQKAAVKEKHAKMRAVARQTPKFDLTKGAPVPADFAMRPGETQNQRMARLQVAKLYVPGAKMSHDYANLVNWGTTDRAKIAQMKRAVQADVQKKHMERYQTTDISKIVDIEKQRLKDKEKMWLRVYGTKDSDKIFKIPADKRKQMCDADAECVRIRNIANK